MRKIRRVVRTEKVARMLLSVVYKGGCGVGPRYIITEILNVDRVITNSYVVDLINDK